MMMMMMMMTTTKTIQILQPNILDANKGASILNNHLDQSNKLRLAMEKSRKKIARRRHLQERLKQALELGDETDDDESEEEEEEEEEQ